MPPKGRKVLRIWGAGLIFPPGRNTVAAAPGMDVFGRAADTSEIPA
jgi:hypothetical protein